MILKVLDIIFLLAYSSLIYWLSDQPSLPSPIQFTYQDKLIHGVAYAIMGWLSWRCLSNFFNRQLPLTITALVYCIVFGLSDEWHQSFVPERSSDVFDWIADTVGASIVIAWLHRKAARRLSVDRGSSKSRLNKYW